MSDAFLIEFNSMLIKTIVHSVLHFSIRLESVSASLGVPKLLLVKLLKVGLLMIKEDFIICLPAERWAFNLIIRCFYHMVYFLHPDHSDDTKIHDNHVAGEFVLSLDLQQSSLSRFILNTPCTLQPYKPLLNQVAYSSIYVARDYALKETNRL
jgi:hypothetical protein